jgi:hypothetical protein
MNLSGRPEEFTLRSHHHMSTERFPAQGQQLFDAWLGRLGPTPTLVWHEMVRRLQEDPDVPTIVVADLGAWAGVNPVNLWRSIDRLMINRRVAWVSGDVLSVEVETAAPITPRRPPRL